MSLHWVWVQKWKKQYQIKNLVFSVPKGHPKATPLSQGRPNAVPEPALDRPTAFQWQSQGGSLPSIPWLPEGRPKGIQNFASKFGVILDAFDIHVGSQNPSKMHQNSIPKHIRVVGQIFYRFLLKFWGLKALKMRASFKRNADFRKIVFFKSCHNVDQIIPAWP